MVKTVVCTNYAGTRARVDKGNYSVLIAVESARCAIISLSHKTYSGRPFIPYVFAAKDPAAAYDKFTRLLGKMCTKQEDSKYFEYPERGEHCYNGHPGDISYEEWEEFAMDMLKEVPR